jgi:hypothetical protein
VIHSAIEICRPLAETGCGSILPMSAAWNPFPEGVLVENAAGRPTAHHIGEVMVAAELCGTFRTLRRDAELYPAKITRHKN